MRVSKKNSAAFTLLEILICLAVFSIGVFAVLRLVLSHMRMVERIQTRTVATFLAKEGLELAYARRNAHLQE
jgi:type II secretion system protein I